MPINRRLLLSAVLLTSISISALAQYPTDETTPRIRQQLELKDGMIVLRRQPLLTASDLPGKISGIEVVCAMWDTTHLGFIQQSGRRVIPATPDTTMSVYLAEFADRAFSHLYTPEGIRLLWMVEDLRIAEKPGAINGRTFIRLKATAYGSTDGGKQYKKLNRVDEFKMSTSSFPEGRHRDDIASAFQELLQKAPEKQDSSFTREEILHQHLQKREIPALMVSQMKDGIYLNFREMQENTPTLTQFEMKKEDDFLTLTGTTTDGRKVRVKSCWGLVKDGRVFRYLDGSLVPLEKFNYGYILSRYRADAGSRNRAVTVASVLGGPLGRMIVAGSSQMLPADAFPALKISPEATAIDMETGAFIF